MIARTLLRTKEVARHVVMVKMSDDASTRVKVDMEDTMLQDTGAVKVSTTPQRVSSPMDESRLLASIAASSGRTLVTEFIRRLKDAGFDSRETNAELHFGILEASGNSFLTLIALQAGGMYAPHSRQLFQIVPAEAISEHRRALNKLGNFYTPEVVEAPAPGFKGCSIAKYDSLKSSPEDIAAELIRFRNVVLSASGWDNGPAA